MKNVILKLRNGEIFYRKLLVPEGLTSTEIMSILNNNEYIKGKINTIPKEGSIFPDTYFFKRNDDIKLIVKRMENRMVKELNKVWKEGKKLFSSKRDLVTFASIIEAETKKNYEKYLVSSVFHNRLKKNMKLQADATVLYGKNLNLRLKSRKLVKRDLKKDTAWNTYTRRGLPITPICNPGLISLKAAISPAKSDYLYFVSDGKGGHRFSKNLEKHNENIKAWKNMNKKND